MKAAKATKQFTIADLKRTAKEADIQLAIRQLLSFMGVPHSITDASRVWGEDGKVRNGKVDEGWPDLSGTWPYCPSRGISLYVETKAARTGFQPGQKECHESLRKAGALVIVPRSLEAFVTQMLANGLDHSLLRKLLPGAKRASERVEKPRPGVQLEEPVFVEEP